MTDLKQITRKEVEEHNNNRSTWIIIGNRVFDVTKFLDEHPGGCEVLLEQAGKDATESFEDVGHSSDARSMAEEYLVGEIVLEEHQKYSYDKKATKSGGVSDNQKRGQAGGSADNLVYLALVGVIFALAWYLLNN